MNKTARAFLSLWINASFLPLAFFIDMMDNRRPADDQASGAEEGANVIELEERRRRMGDV